MILAQLSDPHIVAAGKLFRCPMQSTAPHAERARLEFDTAPYLARAVASLNALVPRPDVTVVTGDLVDHGEPNEYEQLRHLLAPLSMPVFVIPGNHDAREPLREAFRDARYLPAEGYLQFAIEDYPVRLVALDTLVSGKHGGMLCAERLGWLDTALAAQLDRPTVILMHHPPFATGITYMDNFGLDNAAGLAEIVARHPQVERILCGHLHRTIDRRFAGTVAGTAPSTAHQIRLNLVADARISFIFEPPGYQLHLWQQDSGLVTHTAVLDEWPGPAPSSPGAGSTVGSAATPQPSLPSAEELNGYQLFKSLGCVSCHWGVNVGGNLFERHGIFHPLASPKPEILRVPSLRNVATTPPYFHDGSAPTLHEAVRRMASAQPSRNSPG